MTRILKSDTRMPDSGRVESAVIFLHGYGANGADLLGLAAVLAEHMPDTLFLAPDAPEVNAMSEAGLQWFPIPWIDGSSEEDAMLGLRSASQDLNAYLDGVMIDFDLLPEQVIVFGFSQGTMMALHVIPRRDEAIAGLVVFSGQLLEPEALVDDARAFLPILLVHGDQDDVVPIAALPKAVEGLQAAGFKDVYAHVMKDGAHGIAPDGLQVALAFMRKQFGME
ncbi:MAG: prolyl oligopeptidase family serine peptidase [Planktomarina sp.]|jgi:phospholipase/carboxylesterase|nr:prolyl oligopeptidase family serine peptidase [Planktomarina sp.]